MENQTKTKPSRLKYIREYRKRPDVMERLKEYRQRPETKKIIYASFRRWSLKNPQKIKEYQRKAYLKRKANKPPYTPQEKHPLWRVKRNLRDRLREVLNGTLKHKATMKLVGCTFDELKSHLESKFRDGMAWSNYGKLWVIDHILPCASFDFSKPLHQKICFHYTNLQPLLWSENHSKADKILNPVQITFEQVVDK